jgi:hypothetical protein
MRVTTPFRQWRNDLLTLEGHWLQKVGQFTWDIIWHVRERGGDAHVELCIGSRYRKCSLLRGRAEKEMPPEVVANVDLLRANVRDWMIGADFAPIPFFYNATPARFLPQHVRLARGRELINQLAARTGTP